MYLCTPSKVRHDMADVILLAPVWGAPWLPDLLSLATAGPMLLPQAADLFLGLDGLPRPLPRWRTATWRLSGSRATDHVSMDMFLENISMLT